MTRSHPAASHRSRSPSRARRVAWITGVTGQDGSYLAELLLAKGYEVHGLVRRASTENVQRIAHLLDSDAAGRVLRLAALDGGRLTLHAGDLCDGASLRRILELVRPTEVYNLAAQSHVAMSFGQPEYTAEVNAVGVVRLLEALREYRARHAIEVRFYQAGSSEMFGASPSPQSESTPFHPRSPYVCSKVHAHHQTVNHRESYGLYAVNGILFNHESPRRGEAFVTRKITRAAARIKLGLASELRLGRLDVARDWGFAGDYVDAMWRMLQEPAPDDYVVATGVATPLVDFLSLVFARLDLDWHRHVVLDESERRPADVDSMRGDASKARRVLGWRPATSLTALVDAMVARDLELAEREAEASRTGLASRSLPS